MFELVKQHFPHGSGFDIGTQLDFDSSTDEKLVFVTWFHHMHESGMYDGWTEHAVTVTPSLARGFNLRISGRNRNEIKDLIHEYFAFALNLVERETVDGKTVFEDSIGCPVRSVGEMSCQ